ncbi:hypothetical protein M6B38_372055 [Iris pallida]|uniref:Uncharacterized protein n=1 Tax=Iris pallida TaxID=29817 RepID=A0AAX6GD44_IRIPA|nr:hypothetical protein M6B38_372055 [Iris pallida]
MTDPRLRWLNGSDGSWWWWRRVCWPVWAGGDWRRVNKNGGNGGGPWSTAGVLRRRLVVCSGEKERVCDEREIVERELM